MPKVTYTLAKGLYQEAGSGVTFSGQGIVQGRRRLVITTGAATTARDLTVDESGALIVLGSTASQIQIIGLPTITAKNIVVYYDFVVTITGNSGDAGSYTIKTGGHATSSALRTDSYDDIFGQLSVDDASATAADDKSSITFDDGDGTFVLAADTSNGAIAVGTHFRLTAVTASVIGSAGTDVWLAQGVLVTKDATSFVDDAITTAP